MRHVVSSRVVGAAVVSQPAPGSDRQGPLATQPRIELANMTRHQGRSTLDLMCHEGGRGSGLKKIATVLFLVVAVLTTSEFLVVHALPQYTTNVTADEWAYATAIGAIVRVEGWDTTTLAGLGSVASKWDGVAFASNVGKLFGAPRNANAVLIIDPVANTTDITTLGGFALNGDKWIGIAFADNVGKLFAAPYNADAVLIVDPVTNATDITSLTGLGSGVGKWTGITYADIVGKLFAAPYPQAQC